MTNGVRSEGSDVAVTIDSDKSCVAIEVGVVILVDGDKPGELIVAAGLVALFSGVSWIGSATEPAIGVQDDQKMAARRIVYIVLFFICI